MYIICMLKDNNNHTQANIFQVMAERLAEVLTLKDNNKRDMDSASASSVNDKVTLAMSFDSVSRDAEILNKENLSFKLNRRKNDFIIDKQLRIKSYLRRRGIPYRRCSELDTQCGTKSFHLQISKDLDEVVFSGDKELLELFHSTRGIKISDLFKILSRCRRCSNGKSDSVDDQEASYNADSDDDFYDTAKSKNSRDSRTKVEFLTNVHERNKRFKAVKEGLLSKISELESVSGVATLTIILNPDKDLLVYSGDPGLVTKLFTSGITRGDIPVNFNVRLFENDEVNNIFEINILQIIVFLRSIPMCAPWLDVVSPATPWVSS